VASCFNTQWTKHFYHFIRTAKSLKTKFRELVHGPLSGGGKKSLFEQRTLHCKKLIQLLGQSIAYHAMIPSIKRNIKLSYNIHFSNHYNQGDFLDKKV
jgi:hypothetical protein